MHLPTLFQKIGWIATLGCMLLLSALASAGQAERCAVAPLFPVPETFSQTLYVGPQGSAQAEGTRQDPFATLEQAAERAAPGTRIVLLDGEHQTGQFLTRLHGTADAPILITGEEGGEGAFFRGGQEALHLIEPAYVVLRNFTVEQNTSNGINIDDGGDYDTPAHHLILENLRVRNIQASGNIDGMKLSGLDHFHIRNCLVENPGAGGSAIDMVGCHDGVIWQNEIRDCANTGIQAKGGTARITIYDNCFCDAGLRAINLGGSTGLAYFRPMDAPYEAANITVLANVFEAVQTPVAFVGSINSLFANNTVLYPQKWIARILQETTGERFAASGNNVFANNLILIDQQVGTLVNIGPNTAPETFRFIHNAIIRPNDPLGSLNLPGETNGNQVEASPLFLFLEESADQHRLDPQSPLIEAGIPLAQAIEGMSIQVSNLGDAAQFCWQNPPAIGAYSQAATSRVDNWQEVGVE